MKGSRQGGRSKCKCRKPDRGGQRGIRWSEASILDKTGNMEASVLDEVGNSGDSEVASLDKQFNNAYWPLKKLLSGDLLFHLTHGKGELQDSYSVMKGSRRGAGPKSIKRIY